MNDYENCPNCGKSYDEIDYDFQLCSKCGYDAEEQKIKNNVRREPDEKDFLNGEADIATGEWY